MLLGLGEKPFHKGLLRELGEGTPQAVLAVYPRKMLPVVVAIVCKSTLGHPSSFSDSLPSELGSPFGGLRNRRACRTVLLNWQKLYLRTTRTLRSPLIIIIPFPSLRTSIPRPCSP